MTREEALQLVRSDGIKLKNLPKEFKKDNKILNPFVSNKGVSIILLKRNFKKIIKL